jgi:membrane fusion protein, multidrug efflux system
MRRKNLYILLSIALLLVFVAWMTLGKKTAGSEKKQSKAKPQLKVDAYVVKSSKLIDEITVSGSLMAVDEVELRNEITGRVTDLNLPEGEWVKKGTLLVKLFDDDLQATLRKLEAQLAIQEKIYERQAELIKVNGISQNEFEQTALQVNSLKADIDYQKAQIRKTEIRAPFDGVIGLRNISTGAQVSTGTLIATIRTADQLKLDFSVPEKYSPIIKPGMKVRFSTDGTETMYQATVMATERGIDALTRNLKVRALIENPSANLFPGTFTNVALQMAENPNAVMIPTQAIIPSEQNKLVIKAHNGKAHFIPIKTGIRQTSNIEVTEGLQAGDTIIISGLLFLKENMKLMYATVKTDSL